MNILHPLIKLAKRLDQKGLYKEATAVDLILKMASSRNALIGALKARDVDAAKRALVDAVRNASSGQTPAQELGLDEWGFKYLAKAISDGDIWSARNVLNIPNDDDEDTTDTSKYNPFTGRPWPSGPTSVTKTIHDDLINKLTTIGQKLRDNMKSSTGTTGSTGPYGLRDDALVRMIIDLDGPDKLEDFLNEMKDSLNARPSLGTLVAEYGKRGEDDSGFIRFDKKGSELWFSVIPYKYDDEILKTIENLMEKHVYDMTEY